MIALKFKINFFLVLFFTLINTNHAIVGDFDIEPKDKHFENLFLKCRESTEILIGKKYIFSIGGLIEHIIENITYSDEGFDHFTKHYMNHLWKTVSLNPGAFNSKGITVDSFCKKYNDKTITVKPSLLKKIKRILWKKSMKGNNTNEGSNAENCKRDLVSRGFILGSIENFKKNIFRAFFEVSMKVIPKAGDKSEDDENKPQNSLDNSTDDKTAPQNLPDNSTNDKTIPQKLPDNSTNDNEIPRKSPGKKLSIRSIKNKISLVDNLMDDNQIPQNLPSKKFSSRNKKNNNSKDVKNYEEFDDTLMSILHTPPAGHIFLRVNKKEDSKDDVFTLERLEKEADTYGSKTNFRRSYTIIPFEEKIITTDYFLEYLKYVAFHVDINSSKINDLYTPDLFCKFGICEHVIVTYLTACPKCSSGTQYAHDIFLNMDVRTIDEPLTKRYIIYLSEIMSTNTGSKSWITSDLFCKKITNGNESDCIRQMQNNAINMKNIKATMKHLFLNINKNTVEVDYVIEYMKLIKYAIVIPSTGTETPNLFCSFLSKMSETKLEAFPMLHKYEIPLKEF